MATQIDFSIDSSTDAFNIKELWFTNLLLLDFDPVKAEEKHRISFNKDMFNFAQKQGMEAILHYLFSQLNSHLAYEEFRDCWPVYDKKQDQLFRKKSSNWIASIAKEEPQFGLPCIIAPLLLSPGGDKFNQFLYKFSTYCLTKVTFREAKAIGEEVFLPSSVTSPSIVPYFRDVYNEATELHTIRQKDEFLSSLEQLTHLQQKWRSYVHDLVFEYRETGKEKNELESTLKMFEKDTDRPSVNNKATITTTNPVRENNKKKVRSHWRKVESFLQSTACEREIVDSIIEANMHSNRYCIDGKDLAVQVPDVVMTSSNRLQSTGNNDEINLIELLQTCSIGINCLKLHIQRGSSFPDLSQDIEFISTESRAHSSHLNSALNLRRALAKHEEILKDRIQTLQLQLIPLKESQSTTNGFHSITHLLGCSTLSVAIPSPLTHQNLLTPPTPGMKFELTTPKSFTPYHPIYSRATVASTPSAVEEIAASIARRAQKTRVSKRTETPSNERIVSPLTSQTLSTGQTHDQTTPTLATPVVVKEKKRVKPVSRTSQSRSVPTAPPKQVKTAPSIAQEQAPSPQDLLAEQIARAVVGYRTPLKAPPSEERLGFVSRDCIPRTPVGVASDKSRPPQDTPKYNFNWLSKETPPTPFHEMIMESSEESSSRSSSASPLMDNLTQQLLVDVSDN